MKIYVASSWRNTRHPSVVIALRHAGHEVYDFRNPAEGDQGFSWKQVVGKPKEEWSPSFYRDTVLTSEVAARGFSLDMNALMACDACVLVLPCGRSAHLELGYATGAGKHTLVLLDYTIDEPELMYLMNTRICVDMEEVMDALVVIHGAEDSVASSRVRLEGEVQS